MTLGLTLFLLAAPTPVAPASSATPTVASPTKAPAPRARLDEPRPLTRSPYACSRHGGSSRDARLRRSQIAFGVIWALGSAAVIGGAVGVGMTAGDCVGGTCKGTVASAIVLGVGIPVATTGLIGFAVSTGIRRGDRKSSVNVSLAPTSVGMRF